MPRKKKERDYEVTVERTLAVDYEAKVRVKATSKGEAQTRAMEKVHAGQVRNDEWDELDSETTHLAAGDVEEVDDE